MLRIAITVFLLLLNAFRPAFADGERVALVIGVANYKHAPKLVNTLNDAQDMAAALTKLGFRVDLVLDPDRAALEAAVRRFGQMSVGAEASLFHYSGHALEFGGKNWLVPTGADFDTGRNVRFEALELDSVLEQTDGNARVTVVFLDACRDNPFLGRLTARTREVASRGLARVESTASGVMLAFATAPGQVAQDGQGRNSPFTSAILKQIETPGLEIKSLMTQVTREVVETTGGKQRPWQNSSLEGDFYFRAAPAKPAATAERPAAPASLDPEVVYWNSIANSADPADFRAYMAKFPNGVFVDLARNRLIRLLDAMMKDLKDSPAPASPPIARDDPRTLAPAPAPPAPPAAAVARAEPATPVKPAPLPAPPPTPAPLPSATKPPAPAPSAKGPRETLLASLGTGTPQLAPERRELFVRDYLADKGAKAIAYVPGSSMVWRATGRTDAAAARVAALEGCQIFAGRPCALLAVNEQMEPAPASGSPVRDMANVTFAGKFDIGKLPVSGADLSRRADVQAYAAAPGAKAAAIHPTGRFFPVTGTAGQPAAEEAALAACMADPGRVAAGGLCFLYAAGTQVVLPKRLTKARPLPANLPDAFDYINFSQEFLRSYSGEEPFRAMAIEPFSKRTFRFSRVGSQERAEELALEACQMHYGRPCALLASGGDLRAPDLSTAETKSMPRVAYAGAYDPERVPGFRDPKSKDLVAYGEMHGPKAMAIRVMGTRVSIASGKDTLEAQAKALAACNEPDPAYPCFVYAINDRVVFSQRRPEPIK